MHLLVRIWISRAPPYHGVGWAENAIRGLGIGEHLVVKFAGIWWKWVTNDTSERRVAAIRSRLVILPRIEQLVEFGCFFLHLRQML